MEENLEALELGSSPIPSETYIICEMVEFLLLILHVNYGVVCVSYRIMFYMTTVLYVKLLNYVLVLGAKVTGEGKSSEIANF